MRTIKFRAKSMSKKDTQWHYGLIKSIADDGTGFLADEHRSCIHINVDTIGQFTGLLDVNGVEIYEGDVLRLVEDRYIEDDEEFEPFIAGFVTFRDGSFCIKDDCICRYRWYDYVVEVTGDVYECE